MSRKRTSRKKSTTKKTTSRRKKTTSRKKSATRKTTSRRKKTTSRKKSATLSSSQKNLKLRQTPPWERLQNAGFANPVIYHFPWQDRGLSSVAKATYFPGIGYVSNQPHPLLGDYRAKPYSWGATIEQKTTGNSDTPYHQGENPEGFTLRQDQKDDVTTIVQAYRHGATEFLIANGTGTGKTVTTLSAVKSINPKTALIVCPAAVIPAWQRHIQLMGDGGIHFTVINYESLKNLVSPPQEAVNAKKTATQNKHIALKGTPYLDVDMVIVDEAHKTKNPTAQQTRIVDHYVSSARFTLRLTATPGVDPSQLHYLWRLLSYNTGDNITVATDDDLSTYISWCKKHGIGGIVPAMFGNGITFEGTIQDVEKMEKIIYGTTTDGITTAIKRIPGDWLPTARQPYPITISAQEKQDYELLVDNVKKILAEQATARKKDTTKGIAALMSMRQKAGLLKTPHVAEYVDYVVKDLGEQVVVSTIFHATAEALSEQLDAKNIPHVIINGKDSTESKEEKRLQFQTGSVPVVITSLTTGISLHSNDSASGGNSTPRQLVIADIHYSPVEQVQLEGRINRNGQHGVIVFPMLSDTSDEKVVSKLLKGMETQSILQTYGDQDDLAFLAESLGI